MGFTGWLRHALVHVCVCVPLAHCSPTAPVLQAELVPPLHLLRSKPLPTAEVSGSELCKGMVVEHVHLPVVNIPWGLILGLL